MTEETKRKISEANKGREPWNKGKTGVYTKEHIELLRKKKEGFKHTEKVKERLRELGKNTSETARRKRSKSMRGKNHWNWQGGKTKESKRIRKSVELRLWRESVFARDNWTCQECGKRGCELNAHHIKPFVDYPELRTAIDNGITLCKQCHVNRHKTKDKTKEEK